MNRRTFCIFLAALLDLNAFACAAEAVSAPHAPDLSRVAVLDLASKIVPLSELGSLTDRLRAELASTGRFRVVEPGQAEKMVTGNVGRVGTIYTMNLRLLDVGTGTLERTSFKVCDCPLEEVLARVIFQAAADLAGPPAAEAAPEGVAPPAPGSRPATAGLFIYSIPPGAQIMIDGRDAGLTPLVVEEIAPGPHTVRGDAFDHLSWEEQVVAVPRERVELPMVLPPCGYLTAEVTPPDAVLYVDGEEAGRGALKRLALAAGEHQVVARSADYDSLAQTVIITQGKTAFAGGELRYAFGRLRVRSIPSGAAVSSAPPGILGTTPYADDRIAPGQYRVILSMADRSPFAETIQVAGDSTTTIIARLRLSPEAARARNARLKARLRWTSLAAAAAAAGLAYHFERDARDAFADGDRAYALYQQATTTEDAVRWRQAVEEAGRRGDSAAGKRNVFYGLAGGALGLGVILWAW